MWFLSMLAAQAAPDLVVQSVTAGCTGSGGNPTLVVTVRNNGSTASGAFYIDLFRDEPVAPPIGAFGEQYHQVSPLAAGAAAVWGFEFPGEEGWAGWVDVLVDTDQRVSESNENNN